MDIRPQDLPELRAELLTHYTRPMVIDWWARRPTPIAALTVTDDKGVTQAALNPSGDQRRLNEIDRLKSAELYFVSAEMTDLAAAAAASLPAFDIASHDMPSDSGFIIFDKPIALDRNTESGHGEPMFISGASWNLGSVKRWGVALWFSFYVDIHRTLDAEVAEGAITRAEAARQKGSLPRFSYTIDAAHLINGPLTGPVSNDDSVLNSWGRTILSAWLLMQQSLAKVSEAAPDRAAQRRLNRAGQEPKSVRVIELRRPKSSSGVIGESGREYHHRWITRGHWRQQWHPKRQVHRPVWIAPHVKGPEGAPLIGGEKVYALKR